jgi:uncharacterized OB-fold protein
MNIREEIFKKANEGLFICTFCLNCNIFNWPPNNNCKKCLKKTRLRKIMNKGVILEASYSHLPNQKSFFGIGDFSGIRILGTIDRNVQINDFITIYKVSIIDNKISFVFKKIKE